MHTLSGTYIRPTPEPHTSMAVAVALGFGLVVFVFGGFSFIAWAAS